MERIQALCAFAPPDDPKSEGRNRRGLIFRTASRIAQRWMPPRNEQRTGVLMRAHNRAAGAKYQLYSRFSKLGWELAIICLGRWPATLLSPPCWLVALRLKWAELTNAFSFLLSRSSSYFDTAPAFRFTAHYLTVHIDHSGYHDSVGINLITDGSMSEFCPLNDSLAQFHYWYSTY